jgi:N-ethylmaleimide reductase
MYTDAKGMQPYPVPRAMTGDEVLKASAAYVKAAKNALAAGFDGVEIHGANGYLIDQFLSPQTNQRDDQWGGSIAKRCAFALAVSEAVADAIGGEKVGIRLSPYGANADMKPYDEIDATYRYLVGKLVDTGIQYIHIVDHSAMGAPKVPETLKNEMRALWPRDYIVSGGFDKDSAEQALQDKRGDLVAFGRPYIANPDLLQRFEGDVPLADADFSTFYTPGAKGYTDYPASH